jgi:hypothetical protein
MRVREAAAPGAPAEKPTTVLRGAGPVKAEFGRAVRSLERGTAGLKFLCSRRYRCQPCGAVVTVVPRETATGRLYTTSAVAWALALFGVARLPAAHVRRITSPWRVVGAAAVRRWVTLRRWVAAVVEGRLFCRLPRPPNGCDPRQAAGRIAIAVSAHAPPTLASAVARAGLLRSRAFDLTATLGTDGEPTIPPRMIPPRGNGTTALVFLRRPLTRRGKDTS